ncbi:D site-binding protein-like [Leguminivora glycinivorella]|uniref:D site-binding protein-like n=1 Tax=Leguminivora glycinivorella TaxID=1035111 RepID=UPI0020104D51|nr:D site-binding protein-like [Leguminivora glycinivorella]
MALLWTPYADEALDLSKAAVKTEPVAPSPPLLPYMPTTTSPVPFYPAMYHGYPQVPPVSPMYHGYPVPEMSPSSSSGHDEAMLSGNRMATLSPPDSPEANHDHQSLARLSNHVDMEFLTDDPNYQAFERDALRAMAEKNGGTLLGNNPRMRRSVRSTKETVDDSYRQQRERNNFAAKQSRDRRKLREVRLALKVTYLEKEAAKLKAMLASGLCVRCNSFRE